MFPQPISEAAIRADRAERARQHLSDAELTDSFRWFHKTKSSKPIWLRDALWHLGHLLVVLGHQLQDGAANLSAVPPKQVKSV